MGIGKMKSVRTLISIMTVAFAFSMANIANASYVLEFERLSYNAPVDYSDQYSVELNDLGGGNVSFTVLNAYELESSITGVYFQYGDTDLNVTGFTDSDGVFGTDVDFSSPGSPNHLPGGDAYFDNPADYGAHTNGIKPGVDSSTEYITFLANLGTTSYQSLLDAINEGTFRIGLHVQGILPDGQDWSDAYSTVPVPAAAWLFGTALIGFMATSRRRKKIAMEA